MFVTVKTSNPRRWQIQQDKPFAAIAREMIITNIHYARK
jgi:hypothetical protein